MERAALLFRNNLFFESIFARCYCFPFYNFRGGFLNFGSPDCVWESMGKEALPPLKSPKAFQGRWIAVGKTKGSTPFRPCGHCLSDTPFRPCGAPPLKIFDFQGRQGSAPFLLHAIQGRLGLFLSSAFQGRLLPHYGFPDFVGGDSYTKKKRNLRSVSFFGSIINVGVRELASTFFV